MMIVKAFRKVREPLRLDIKACRNPKLGRICNFLEDEILENTPSGWGSRQDTIVL